MSGQKLLLWLDVLVVCLELKKTSKFSTSHLERVFVEPLLMSFREIHVLVDWECFEVALFQRHWCVEELHQLETQLRSRLVARLQKL